MPMSVDFEQRLEGILPEVADHFGTPFYIYDESGITETVRRINAAFSGLEFREFFAVKAVSNPRILELLAQHGVGFDCGAVPDLTVAARAGATGADMIFSANNTTSDEFAAARAHGALVNIDDLAGLTKLLPDLPETLCFRLNPGILELSGQADLVSTDQKFGMRPEQLFQACALAKSRGTKHFGLHAMLVTQQLTPGAMLETLSFLLRTASALRERTGTVVEFVDLGGGLGIPFHHHDKEFDLESFGLAATDLVTNWAEREGVARPALYLESGRYVTGPHGVLVTRVINRMTKWRTFIGVDSGVSAMLRPALYDTAYHHISVHGARPGRTEVVDVVGSMCENNDKLGTGRQLPPVSEGDLLYLHDVGAHGYSMGFTYNNRLRPKELLLRSDGTVELIRRAETEDDHFATLRYAPRTFVPAATRPETVLFQGIRSAG